MKETAKPDIVTDTSCFDTRTSTTTAEIEEGVKTRNTNPFGNKRMEFTARAKDAFPQKQKKAGNVEIEFACIGNSSLHRKFNKALKPPIQPIRKLTNHVSSTYNNSHKFDLSSSTIMSSCTFEGDFQISSQDLVNDNLFMIYGSSVETQTTSDSTISEIPRFPLVTTCSKSPSSIDRKSIMSNPPVPPQRQNSVANIYAEFDLGDSTDSSGEFSEH